MSSSGEDSLVAAGFDALAARVAILDTGGTIVYTNESWESFGDEQGLARSAGGVGSNYLAVCEASDDPDAVETARGIRAIAAGDSESFRLEYPCHTPGEDGWYLLDARPYDHGGERFVLVMHVDITERKLLERRTQEQADRMESFATLLSHDLRNPLSVALAHTEMLELDDGVDLGDDSDENPLRASLERMESIIDEALHLTTIDAVEETELLALSRAVETAWTTVRTDGASVDVVDDIAIRADPSLLTHLFENLFRNAVEHGSTSPDSRTRQDAVEHGGDGPRIEVGALESTAADGDRDDEAAKAVEGGTRPTDWSGEAADYDGFYVEDDGPGIPPDERAAVFESGYSSAGGSGFGLAIVSDVVDAHGWSISIASGRNGGARFEVRGVTVVER
ncbi:PAS domain-containing sensor histidine kinase [Natrinema thermotolerans]|uniref:histidine kinase n=1 Tax=Natrinema thermotolerans TaxID=121872 RepID=A0AAF0T143_9EURY|nr:PAS domain-containing sensor histidine kinase [Natrinema thermotolerans]QCC60712.1 PAS domain-containing sensor histidine kinase [Natrinema thermotolerans]QCC61591.1 PAS domain-containing sensor histidine kinase [Natrinema thermotolerans]WMT07755.1 PAS domain-containing sensor histidine kinase [Natrinema thermotolerans]WMT08387.1 PAS domain-containing sensor histidine kinase [Natrinema thermotolerans]